VAPRPRPPRAAQVRLLKKSSKGPEVGDADSFTFNAEFSDPRYRIKVGTGAAGRGGGVVVANGILVPAGASPADLVCLRPPHAPPPALCPLHPQVNTIQLKETQEEAQKTQEQVRRRARRLPPYTLRSAAAPSAPRHHPPPTPGPTPDPLPNPPPSLPPPHPRCSSTASTPSTPPSCAS
jgi:hypothetical protein